MTSQSTLLKQATDRYKLYQKITISSLVMVVISLIMLIITKNPTLKKVWALLFILMLTWTIVIGLNTYNTLKVVEHIRTEMINIGFDHIGRSSKLDIDALINGIAPKIGSDLFVNVAGCELSPEWCAADAAGNFFEIAVCKANHKSKACKDAKAIVNTIDFIPNEIAKVFAKTLTKLDSTLHAKGYLAGDIGVALATGSAAVILAQTGAALGGAIGFGVSEAALSAAGPIGLAVGAVAYGAYEACKHSAECRKLTSEVKDDIKEALTHMVTGPNIKKANVDFKDSGYWFKKGNIGKGFKDLGKGMLDII